MTTHGLLTGLKVLDFSLWQPGHYATQLLADLGADVLKVEPPGGDRMRVMPDRFVNFNGNKRSVVLDLKRDEDRARALELAGEADVVVEGYRPGVAERLGVGYSQLSAINPALVYCSISGFGQVGPLAAATGHDVNYQAYAGALLPAGAAAPVVSNVLIADEGSGMSAAFAILAGVLGARRTGEGDHIDVSMTDVVASWVAPMGSIDQARGETGETIAAPAMGTFAVSDGFVVLGVYTEDHLWDAMCRALGLEAHVGLDVAQRTQDAVALRDELTAALGRESRDELVARLSAVEVPIAPVLTRDEMLDHPHFWSRGLFSTGPDGGRALGHPVRFSKHPALPPGRPPELDQHSPQGFGSDGPSGHAR